MQFKDYYETLGLEPSAGEAEIKTAYRRLARKYHPDVSKEAGAEEKFKAVNEAYEALRDPQKRTARPHDHRVRPQPFECRKHRHEVGRRGSEAHGQHVLRSEASVSR